MKGIKDFYWFNIFTRYHQLGSTYYTLITDSFYIGWTCFKLGSTYYTLITDSFYIGWTCFKQSYERDQRYLLIKHQYKISSAWTTYYMLITDSFYIVLTCFRPKYERDQRFFIDSTSVQDTISLDQHIIHWLQIHSTKDADVSNHYMKGINNFLLIQHLY